ncbi:MAG: glycosyltransferase family 2 protein [Rhodospirillales bacterium]|nr:glycosyltransferase family 2 protein [Rhodospirillales bacterium]
MTIPVLETCTIGALTLAAYHHAVFPWILGQAAKRKQSEPVENLADPDLPEITVLIPAHNEAGVIADKIRNLAMLDYPTDKLDVIVALDGCDDETFNVARDTCREPECRDLQIRILNLQPNRGKLCVLNEMIPRITSEIVVLSDASALLSIDALQRFAGHMADTNIGVVAATYKLAAPGSVGEKLYWDYQVTIKLGEASLGAPLGVHGACYAFRSSVFEPLPPHTINDDFIMPMNAIRQGKRIIYDTDIVALELETSDVGLDFRRRRRIAAGNMQQLLMLKDLLHPKYRGVALAFASGKALRTLMPYILLFALFGSAVLAASSVAFLVVFLMLAAGLVSGGVAQFIPGLRRFKPFALCQYLVSGYAAGFVGATRYLFGLELGGWKRSPKQGASS